MIFRRWGYFVARRPKLVIIVSLVLLLVTLPFIPGGLSRLTAQGWDDPGSESYKVEQQLAQDFGQEGSSLWVVFSSDTLRATDPAFQAEVQQSIAPLRERPEVTAIVDYASTGSERFISFDGHKTYVLINTSADDSQAEADLKDYRSLLASSPLEHHIGGWAAANEAFSTLVERDLQTMELVALPITLLLLVLVFGSLVAAGLPLAIGILSIPAALGGIAIMAHLTDVSIYVLNIATIIGLAVSIDYSLFLVTRFREELTGKSVPDAIAQTMATSGKAVFVSAIIVAVGLLGMIFFPMYALRSLGVGGALVIGLAIFYALTVLPALLVLLGPRVNKLRVRKVAERENANGFWHRVATQVMAHPWRVMVPVVVLLVGAGLPFLHVNFATPGMDMLPRSNEARVAYELLMNDFPDTQVSPAIVLATPEDGATTSPEHLAALRGLIERLEAVPGVERVESIYDLAPSGANAPPEEIAAILSASDPRIAGQAHGLLNEAGARLNVISHYSPDSTEAKDLVRDLRNLGDDGGSLRMAVGGATATDIDMNSAIVDRIPYAVAFILVVTYVVLFLLLGSVVLPLKAILMAGLSITASFGALIWIFQDGHLAGLFHFDPTGYTVPMIPVMMFCILFGLSMDYEVLMLSRMQEEYHKHGDNRLAVARGLERTGRVITSAALIMMVVFGAAVFNKLLLLASLGIGMAIAVAIDATIVRALLVPAAMRLMGSVNWWAPASLKRLYRRAGLAEVEAPSPPPATREPTPVHD